MIDISNQCRILIITKQSKLQLKVQKNLLKKKCVTLLPDEFNDPNLYANSQINTTIENEIKLTENNRFVKC